MADKDAGDQPEQYRDLGTDDPGDHGQRRNPERQPERHDPEREQHEQNDAHRSDEVGGPREEAFLAILRKVAEKEAPRAGVIGSGAQERAQDDHIVAQQADQVQPDQDFATMAAHAMNTYCQSISRSPRRLWR